LDQVNNSACAYPHRYSTGTQRRRARRREVAIVVDRVRLDLSGDGVQVALRGDVLRGLALSKEDGDRDTGQDPDDDDFL
jgi:hypothetical protein